MPEKKEESKEPKITEDIQYDYYADITRIAVSERTVVLDFGQIMPFKNEFRYQVRILMSPEHFIPFVELVQKFAGRYKPSKREEK